MRYDDPSAKALNHAAFIIETVAHLQGHEQTLLPYVKKLRAYAKKLEAAYYGRRRGRKVARTQINPEVSVSTVFLGLDHNFDVEDEIPVLFETMIFGGKEDQFQSRCHTWEEAEVMHENACELAREAE